MVDVMELAIERKTTLRRVVENNLHNHAASCVEIDHYSGINIEQRHKIEKFVAIESCSRPLFADVVIRARAMAGEPTGRTE